MGSPAMNTRKIIYLAMLIYLTGCATEIPKPWQREKLSHPAMQLTHPFDTRFDKHLYYSRESTSGGQGFSAGGCGCN